MSRIGSRCVAESQLMQTVGIPFVGMRLHSRGRIRPAIVQRTSSLLCSSFMGSLNGSYGIRQCDTPKTLDAPTSVDVAQVRLQPFRCSTFALLVKPVHLYSLSCTFIHLHSLKQACAQTGRAHGVQTFMTSQTRHMLLRPHTSQGGRVTAMP